MTVGADTAGVFTAGDAPECVTRRTFSGQDVVKALRKNRFKPAGRSGSHVRLVYKHPNGEVRRVTVPMHDEIAIGTLRNIANQAGANDFDKFCEWIENNC